MNLYGHHHDPRASGDHYSSGDHLSGGRHSSGDHPSGHHHDLEEPLSGHHHDLIIKISTSTLVGTMNLMIIFPSRTKDHKIFLPLRTLSLSHHASGSRFYSTPQPFLRIQRYGENIFCE